jgi:TolB-like protein
MVDTDMVQPTPDEVHRQLDRIVASEGFANADRMSAFLRYVVGRVLAGEADQVKEYVIGVEVFGRDPAFDPRLDSIVRVEARRLRTKVDEYYAGPGAADDLLIQLRRGSYAPSFERRQPAPAPMELPPPPIAAPATGHSRRFWRVALGLGLVALALVTLAARRGGLWATDGKPTPDVSVAVLPFAHYSTDPEDALLAARLTDAVTAELARLGTVGVVAHTSVLKFATTPRKSAREIGQALNADMIVEGSIRRSGDRLDVSIRLVNPHTERKMWIQDFTGEAQNPRGLERQIAAAVAPAAVTFKPVR